MPQPQVVAYIATGELPKKSKSKTSKKKAEE
jgi:hypothetical protein